MQKRTLSINMASSELKAVPAGDIDLLHRMCSKLEAASSQYFEHGNGIGEEGNLKS